MEDRAFAFVLGAGASRTSGIKSAGEMVCDWRKTLHGEAVGCTESDAAKWATKDTLGIPSYDPDDPAACYSHLYRRMFASDPGRGYAYLEAEMKSSEPSYGYSVLARIMEGTRHKVVVTTNFDNLVADSLSIFSTTYPLVCGHESLAGFIRARVRRPLVVKVHHDLLLAPKSTPDEIATLPDAFKKALQELFRHYTPIVMGYGGNDGSLMSFLNELPPNSIPGGVFWCYWEGGSPPSGDIRRFVAAQRGCLVPIPGFDETMMLLGDRLGHDVPDQFLRDRAETRAKRIVDQVTELRKRLTSPAATPASAPVAGSVPVGPSKPPIPSGHGSPAALSIAPVAADPGAASVKSELTKAINQTMQRTDGKLRWWQWDSLAQAEPDKTKSDEIYRKAIDALPESCELLCSYAIFLTKIRKEHARADEYFKKALEAAPSNAAILGNYALFLASIPKEHERAEEYYKKALEVDPNRANTLGNYANFLKDIRKEHDRAEEYYKRALEVDPNHANNLGNYASFLRTIRKSYDRAEEYYLKSLEADPNHATNLGNYASFLTDMRKSHDRAEEYYKKALEADPNRANNLGNYAHFLTDMRKSHDRAEEYYLKALEADPNDANILGNYAIFLTQIRKDHDRAEEYYKKALEADPNFANNLGNYAIFLTQIRKDHDRAEEYYKKALEADPNDANNLGNYANMLLGVKQTERGLGMLKRAIAALPVAPFSATHAEVWMYAVCHWLPDEWRSALRTLKKLLIQDKVTTGDWDFSGVIESAKVRGHPDAQWLDPLAKVCAGKADPSTLDGWKAWKDA